MKYHARRGDYSSCTSHDSPCTPNETKVTVERIHKDFVNSGKEMKYGYWNHAFINQGDEYSTSKHPPNHEDSRRANGMLGS